jgi:hypothetical protein
MTKKNRLVRAWSKADVKNLRILARAKLSGPQVAQKLRRTRGAVAQKAMPLGVIHAICGARSGLRISCSRAMSTRRSRRSIGASARVIGRLPMPANAAASDRHLMMF